MSNKFDSPDDILAYREEVKNFHCDQLLTDMIKYLEESNESIIEIIRIKFNSKNHYLKRKIPIRFIENCKDA